jgi:hypothetical protein
VELIKLVQDLFFFRDMGGEFIYHLLQIGNYPGDVLDFDLGFFSGNLLFRQFRFQGYKVPRSRVLISRLDAECRMLFHEDCETKRGRGI